MSKINPFLFVFLLVSFCFTMPQQAAAESTAKIVILPFVLEAEKPNPGLSKKIVSMISDLLQKEGAQVIVLPDTQDPLLDLPHKAYNEIGIENGADYVLTGSLFAAGSGISIDATLINTFVENDQVPIFAQTDSFENLFAAVSKASKEITSVVFQKKLIADIVIAGNKRIEQDVILRSINTQAGDILKPEQISRDIKAIYSMGYFDNVVVKKEDSDKGVRLVYTVTEKSTVRRIKFRKNVILEDEELKELVNTRTGSILNIHKLKADINRMRLVYTSKNYHNIVIQHEIIPLENAQADIVFTFDEGEKVRVEKITFEGHRHFSAGDLKDEIKTSERGFFSFFTSSGDLDEIEVKNDVIRIESLYKNSGFIDAKVSDPIIDIGKESITVHFKIDEGPQYTIDKVRIEGDLIQSREVLFDIIKSKTGEFYNREYVRKDILAMSDAYLNQGFANVNITPMVDKNTDTRTMNITFTINKGKPVYFDRIIISGNSKTRDKVIRRELMIQEGGLYSKERIAKSHKNINRLDYFSTFSVKPVKTDIPDRMNLEVDVEEKSTGTFSFGGGFSTEENAFGVISVTERNIFGRGHSGQLSAKVSGETVLYNIKFYEPYIMDTRISGGFDLYKEEREYDHYDKDSIGLTLSLGYKLYDYTRIGMHYNIEDFDISDVETASTNMTPGSFLSSSLKPYIRYDTRNDIFLPTEGQKHEASLEYAGSGLGGDIDYIKYLAETSFYFPLFWKFSGLLHAEAGYIDDRTNNTVDIDYVRFYLGGMHSVRGFDKYDINGQRSGDAIERGGEKYVQFNAEITFPLTEKYKMAGVIFYDRGDVYRTSEDINLGDQFSSVGCGIRWNSPVGPLRIEYGWVIDGKDIKDSGDGQFEFSVGASF